MGGQKEIQGAQVEFEVFVDCIWGDRKEMSKVTQGEVTDFIFLFVNLKIIT